MKNDRPLPDEPLFGPDEAARRLGMSTKTMMRHVRAGRLRYINVGTQMRKKHLFTPYQLMTFIENQKVREVPPWQSIDEKAPHFIATNSKSTVSGFSDLQKPEAKKKLKQ